MKVLGMIAALVAALLLVAALPCAIWSFSATEMMLSADTYTNIVSQEGVFTDLLPAIIPAIVEASESVEGPGNVERDASILNDVAGNLDEQAWAAITADLIPPDWLQEQLHDAVEAFFAWVHGESDEFGVRLELATVRERLAGEPGQRAVNRIIESWPPCTGSELEQLQLVAESRDIDPGAMPFCQPPGEYMATTSAILSFELASFARQLPNVWPEPEDLSSPQFRVGLNEIRQSVRVMEAVVVELLLVPLALLALIVFFTVRSLKSFGRWSGGVLIVGGIFTLIPVLLLFPLLLGPLAASATFAGDGSIALGGGAGGPAGAAGAVSYIGVILQEITRILIGELTLPVVVISAAAIGLGFLLLMISIMARSHAEEIADATARQELNSQMMAHAASQQAALSTPTPQPTGTNPIDRTGGTPPGAPPPSTG